ncbi:regulatory protein RecX [Thiomicrorhabdus sediminis]|uniref:Regulatory protein RecX n=1 Tax=Thiomicrorhabdus sediminis TaxID=2580412 RepID=A0A4P9K645_9GAMM|nr:regulatory protein RecX [Thiomicrorhabdus sediminis]QCU89727.1 regulatory protein RecX [Thiomicrorhabdus sediminis]
MKDAEAFLKQLNNQVEDTAGSQDLDNQDEADQGLLASELAYQVEAKAVALLAMREHGGRELRQKLRQKFPESVELLQQYDVQCGDVERIIGLVLEKCRVNNWQSDQRYVEQAVQSYLGKGHGPMKIAQKLKQTCADSGLIDAELDLGDEEWLMQARAVLEKKYGDTVKPSSRNEQGRRMRFLQSRGFPPGLIWKAFD